MAESIQEQAIRLYEDTKLTGEEIAEQLGVSRSTVYNWLKQAGITTERRRRSLPDVLALAQKLSELEIALSRTEKDDRWRQSFERLALIDQIHAELGIVVEKVDSNYADRVERASQFGFRLSELRRDQEMTTTQLAAMNATISQLSGRIEGLNATIQTLAGALQTTLAALVERERPET